MTGRALFGRGVLLQTDWLSGIAVTTTEDDVGLVVFWESRVVQAAVIMLIAFQSSSSSLVSPWFGKVAADAQIGLV